MKEFNNYTLQLLYLADTSLILGHRNSEWTGHGPVLEQDIAISNIALDLIGQARNFYQLAAEELNALHDPAELSVTSIHHTEDTLAYLRDSREYYNLLIAEQPRGDWAFTTLRQYLVSSFQELYYKEILHGSNRQQSGIAEKSLKEIRYHKKWSGEWVIRLGDGTAESRKRLLQALEDLWRFTGEFFEPATFELSSGIDPSTLTDTWTNSLVSVLEQATILNEWQEISSSPHQVSGGKSGIHTEQLGYILAEMQFLQRAYPGCEW